MKASTSKDYGDFAKSLEDELLKYTSNHEETNVTDHSDSTECSSSFGGSDCGDEGADASEVLSDFCVGAESPFDFHGSLNLFKRRRKLDSHWRTFIHPVMWRCKWVELQIKKLEGQARKYDRKLEGYSQKIRERSSLEGHAVRRHTFSQNNRRREMMRRKKRRRAEETSDIAAYMSRHNLFSYYEHRKYIREISHDVLKNPERKTQAPSIVHAADARTREEVRAVVELGNDEGCHKSLVDILQKIDVLRSLFLKLKSRLEKVMADERVKLYGLGYFSSSTSLSCPPTTPSYRTPVGNYIASQLLAEYNLGAVLLPSNDEAAAPHANGAIDHPHSAYAYENEEEIVLIDNQWVREELPYFEEYLLKRPQPPPPPPPPIICSTSNLVNASTPIRRRLS